MEINSCACSRSHLIMFATSAAAAAAPGFIVTSSSSSSSAPAAAATGIRLFDNRVPHLVQRAFLHLQSRHSQKSARKKSSNEGAQGRTLISSRVAFSLLTRIQLLTAFSTFFASACKMALVTRQLQQKARERPAAATFESSSMELPRAPSREDLMSAIWCSIP